jgi:glycerophosphoryl diester phosphodiesterase
VSAFSGKTGVVVVGHRGGRGESWPAENTLEAFERAVEQGAQAIELDVRTCATGEAVVFHDPDLGRMTRGEETRKIAQLTMRDLVRVRLHGGARVPTLDEVLDWAKARCAVNVELKRDVPSRPHLARAASKPIREARADVLVSSFDPLLLTTMRALAPRAPRAYLTIPDARPIFPPLGLAAVHYGRQQATAENIALAKQKKLLVGVWTVNEEEEAKNLAKLGVSWLITDEPARIVAALRAKKA